MLGSINATAVLAVVGYAVAAVVALGGVLGVLRSQALRSSVELLRAEKDDLRSMVETLQAWRRDAERTLESQSDEIQVLREAVTHAAAVGELTELVRDNHAVVLARLDRLEVSHRA